MAHAYATIANKGRKVELSTISQVSEMNEQGKDEVIYTAPEPEGEQVIAPAVAAKATEILVGDVKKGIAHKADLEDRTVAGKTGTSERFFRLLVCRLHTPDHDRRLDGATPKATLLWEVS